MKTLILFAGLLALPAFAQTVDLPTCEEAMVNEATRAQALSKLHVYGRDLQLRVTKLDLEWQKLQADYDAGLIDSLTMLSEFTRVYEEQEKMKAEFAVWSALADCIKQKGEP